MLVKDIIQTFSQMNPNENVWITWVTDVDVKEKFSEVEYTDENDNLIDTDPYVTKEVLDTIYSSLDNDDYLWERFSENFSETCREVLSDLIQEKEKAKEDTELWDKE